MDEREAVKRDPELEARIKEIENMNFEEELATLAPAFNEAVRNAKPEPWSGLVELHYWLEKLEEKKARERKSQSTADGQTDAPL
jgi:hypothetical protein